MHNQDQFSHALPSRGLGIVVALMAPLVVTCSNETFGVFSEFTGDAVAGISVSLIAEPVTVSLGDTIHFRALATNRTSQRVQIGIECGPSMDVLLIAESGRARSALADLVGPNGAFTCELGPYHFVRPDSTREQVLKWPAITRGQYHAVAGLRRSDGLGNRSSPVRVIVQ